MANYPYIPRVPSPYGHSPYIEPHYNRYLMGGQGMPDLTQLQYLIAQIFSGSPQGTSAQVSEAEAPAANPYVDNPNRPRPINLSPLGRYNDMLLRDQAVLSKVKPVTGSPQTQGAETGAGLAGSPYTFNAPIDYTRRDNSGSFGHTPYGDVGINFLTPDAFASASPGTMTLDNGDVVPAKEGIALEKARQWELDPEHKKVLDKILGKQ